MLYSLRVLLNFSLCITLRNPSYKLGATTKLEKGKFFEEKLVKMGSMSNIHDYIPHITGLITDHTLRRSLFFNDVNRSQARSKQRAPQPYGHQLTDHIVLNEVHYQILMFVLYSISQITQKSDLVPSRQKLNINMLSHLVHQPNNRKYREIIFSLPIVRFSFPTGEHCQQSLLYIMIPASPLTSSHDFDILFSTKELKTIQMVLLTLEMTNIIQIGLLNTEGVISLVIRL